MPIMTTHKEVSTRVLIYWSSLSSTNQFHPLGQSLCGHLADADLDYFLRRIEHYTYYMQKVFLLCGPFHGQADSFGSLITWNKICTGIEDLHEIVHVSESKWHLESAFHSICILTCHLLSVPTSYVCKAGL